VKLRFDSDAARRWAGFSGDFNPIHFDIDRARLAGADHLIVHGMLALLHIKQATSDGINFSSRKGEQWHQFKALFRSTLPQNEAVDLSLTPKPDAVFFRLKNDEREYFKGNHALVRRPEAAGQIHEPAVKFDPQQVGAKYTEFRAAFPFASASWIFLDALVFSNFLQDAFAALGDQADRKIVVQISHRVAFDPRLAEEIFRSAPVFSELGYSVKHTEVLSQEGGQFGAAELNVVLDRQPIMQVEIGLLSKEVAD
jgi:hypothetical protein